jgi:O-antigen/teichoic acid export membrane protein
VLWFHRDLRWLLIGTALGRGIVAVATLIMVARDASGWAVPKLDRAVVARFVAYGVPMLGWTLSSRVLGLSDRFVIEAYHGSAAVGVYSANYALVTMGFGLLSGPLLIAAHPLIVAAWKDHGAERAPETIASFSRLYVLGLMPVVAILALCSREVAAILLGHTFREGHEIIPILVLGIFVWGFSMYGHKGLELAERTNIMFVFAAITAAVNVILNFIFVPAYGYKAAAVTTLASAFVYPILVHWVSKRYIPWRIPWATVVQAAGASAAAFMLGALVKRALASNPPLVVASVTSVAMISVYAAILWWLHRRGRNRKGNA